MSNRFTLNQEDINKSLKNALIFLAPALIIYLTAVQNGDFNAGFVAIKLWVFNTMIDILRKFIADNK